MPKRKARKSQFSALALRLKTNSMKGCVLQGKGWAISRSQDTEERRYEMMNRGMRHEEVQKLHVDDLHVFTLITRL